MPTRKFIRCRKAWYDFVNDGKYMSEEFMLSFDSSDGEDFNPDLDGEIALRYHDAVRAWRLEAFDDSMRLVPHFNDVLVALSAKGANYDGDGLEKLMLSVGVSDKTTREPPNHLKNHPLISRSRGGPRGG